MDIKQEQIEQKIKEKGEELQEVVSKINTNALIIEEAKAETVQLAQRARQLEGGLETLQELKGKKDGAKPKGGKQ